MSEARQLFQAARETADRCLLEGNAAIHSGVVQRAAARQAGYEYTVRTLPADLRSLFEMMDEGQGRIYALVAYLRRVATAPVKHDRLTNATAHELAWAFAHHIWLTARLTILNAEVIELLGTPEDV